MKPLKKSNKEEEEVILCKNEHWIVLVRPAATLMVTWAIFGFLFYVSQIIAEASQIVGYILLLLAFLMIFLVTHWFMMMVIHWELSKWIVTTKRMIDFQNTPFIKNDVAFVNIQEIHEIEKKKHGLLQNLFNFGMVHVNLAASPEPVIFYNIPVPGAVVNLVESIRDNRLGEEIDLKSLQGIFGRKYRALFTKR